MTKKEIGQRIREIRLSKGMSQEAFAKLLGYASRSSVNKLEEGVAELSFDKAAIIIDKFGPEALDLLLPLASSTLALENNCLICQRISDALKGTNPNFVAELSTGIVCLGDNQRFPGYTYFLSKTHVHELHELPRITERKFLSEMALVEEAVSRVFKSDKMNIEILGNGDSHLHVHLIPRHNGDLAEKGPIWWASKEELFGNRYKITPAQRKLWIPALQQEIKRLGGGQEPGLSTYEKGAYRRQTHPLLGKEVHVVVDRPLGSHHPQNPMMVYPVNYGYIESFNAPDEEKQDAYILGVDEPLAEFDGIVIAILERDDDVEDKLIVAPRKAEITDQEIEKQVAFQEKYFIHRVFR